MKFLKIKLFTNKLNIEFEFYTKKLGFKAIKQTQDSFTVKVGWTEIEFEKSKIPHIYHYCFLIPSTLLNNALEWMDKKVDILSLIHI